MNSASRRTKLAPKPLPVTELQMAAGRVEFALRSVAEALPALVRLQTELRLACEGHLTPKRLARIEGLVKTVALVVDAGRGVAEIPEVLRKPPEV